MHEVGITTSMIEIALDHARTQGGGAKIHSLTMEIGALPCNCFAEKSYDSKNWRLNKYVYRLRLPESGAALPS